MTNEARMTFDDIKTSFWSARAHGVQPALTQAIVADAEQTLGLRLPASLLALLRVRNGGGVVADRNAFPTDRPTSWSEDHIPFTHLLGVGTGGRGRSLLETPYLVTEWELPFPVVLLSGDGHYWIALDYRTRGPLAEPSVTWFDTDSDTELPLAPDFRTFVEGLRPISRFGERPA
jgi:hypothetical protein